MWNNLQLLLPHHRHVIQTNHKFWETGPVAILHTDVGGGPTGGTTTLDQVRTTPDQMRVLYRVGTHHIAFLQDLDWQNKSLLEGHLPNAATTAGRQEPTDEEVCDACNLFWDTRKQHLPQSPPNTSQPHDRPPGHVKYISWRPTDSKSACKPAGQKATYR